MKYRHSIFIQLLIVFFIAAMLSLLMSLYNSINIATKAFVREREMLFSGVAETVEESIKAYDSYEWVFHYLLNNSDSDLGLYYEETEETKARELDFFTRHGYQDLTGIKAEQVEGFSEEDKKQFVRMVYYQWIKRMDELLDNFNISHLSVLIFDNLYKDKIFLLSGSNGKHKRGYEADDDYLFDTIVKNKEKEIEALKDLEEGEVYYEYKNKDYMSVYKKLFNINGRDVYVDGAFFYYDSFTEITKEIFKYFLSLIVVQLIIFALCIFLISYFILRPILILRKDVQEYSITKNGEVVRGLLEKIKYNNEIGLLATDISEMTKEISKYIEEIQKITGERERINAELNMASRVQSGMLPDVFPPFPGKNEFDIYAIMEPAKEVGGDFYDFYMVDDKHLALVIADVSGKGMPAALFMVISKTLIKNRSMMGGTPEEIIYDVNNQLCEENKGEMFVTVWMAIIDIETGKGLAINAGHEHPALQRSGGSFELIRYPHSPMLAVIRGMKFKEHAFTLHPGDRLVVYTDGFPEATNREDELYGLERVIQSLNRHQAADIKGLLERLIKDINEFTGDAGQFDDITMLVFDYKGKE